MIKEIKINKMFGGKGELSNFHSVSLSADRQREAVAMKNIFRNKRIQICLALLMIFTVQTQAFTDLAVARSSGGGEVAKFDTGKFALSVGIGLASMAVGNSISSGMNSAATTGGSFATGAGNALTSYGSSASWISSYNSMAALNQLGAAISMTGQQQGWDVSTTTFVSSVAQGVVGGGLNPSGTLGAGANSTIIKAMGVGAISGVVEGGILANTVIRSNDSAIHGTQDPWVSFGAGLAGSFAGGIAASSIASVVPSKAGSYKDYVASGGITKDNQSFGPVNQGWYNKNALASTKATTFGQVLTHGATRAFSAIPSSAVSMGVSSITKDMDKQDAFMVRQAFSGVYPITGVAYGNYIRDPIFEKTKGLKNYVGNNGLTGTALQKIDRSVITAPTLEIKTK